MTESTGVSDLYLVKVLFIAIALFVRNAGISVGLIKGEAFLDLNYAEDVAADVDFNVVMNSELELIEVQGTAEAGSFSRSQMNQMLDLAEMGIKQLLKTQQEVLTVSSEQ